MKKVFFVAISMIAISSSITSCSKCGHCKFADGTLGNKFCDDDVKLAKAACEADWGDGPGKWVNN